MPICPPASQFLRLLKRALARRSGRSYWGLDRADGLVPGSEDKEDIERFKELGWGLRTWDLWNWNDCLPREIHVNDCEAYFTGATNVSVMIGQGVSRPK